MSAGETLVSSGRYDVSVDAGSAGRIDMTADELTLLSTGFAVVMLGIAVMALLAHAQKLNPLIIDNDLRANNAK